MANIMGFEVKANNIVHGCGKAFAYGSFTPNSIVAFRYFGMTAYKPSINVQPYG